MVLQVGTTQFQSTAGQSSRSPVETFVEPVNVLPKTGLMSLAETLSDINPTLQKFVNFQIDKAKQQGILEGQNQLLNADPVKLKEIKKELEKKEGKLFARNFLGGNIYTQYGIEKQLAINLGNASEAKTAAFFENYTVDGIPLSQFDVSSEGFQKAIKDFEATSLTNTRGIRPEILNQYFFPKQNLALSQFYSEHQSKLAEAKLEQAASLLEPTILNSWFQIDSIDKQIELNIIDTDGFQDGYSYSLNELQNSIDDYVNRGLSSLVSPAKLLGYMETNILKIFEYYEDNELDMNLAYEEIEEYVEWIGGLEVGPAKQPFNTFFIKDGENKVDTILKNVFEKKEQVIDKQNKFEKAYNQRTILNTLNGIDFTNTEMTLNDYKVIGQTLEDLAVRFPNEIQFTYEQYDLKNINVDNYFSDIKEDYDGGSLSQAKALQKAQEFMLALGPAASDTDRETYGKLKEHINKTQGKTFNQRFPEVKILQDIGAKKLGEKSGPLGISFTTKSDYVDQEIDLNQELRKRVTEASGVTPEIRDWYKGELRKILSKQTAEEGGYDFYDDLNDFSIKEINNNNENNNNNNNNDKYIKNQENIRKNLLEPAAFTEGGFTKFKIESGDTLSAISNDFGIPMEAIMKANGITNANQIDIGDVLLIPEGVDYTDLNNINFIENLDKTKLITEKEHPYAPVREKHNFQVIYNIAKEIGIKYPELVAAQAMEETGFGETQSAENNFLGLKATPSEVAKGESERKLTTEFRGQGEQLEEANFKTFDNIRAMMMQYKKQWNDDFRQYKGLVNANSIQEAIKMLQAEDYATNPDYDKNVLDIIDRAIKEGWF